MGMRILGTLQVVLGLGFWTGNFATLVPLHMLLGLLLVILLWAIAVAALVRGVMRPFAVVALLWGLLVLALGLTQQQILPGDLHWIIQVLHLLVGIGAVGISERLNRGLLDQGVVGLSSSPA
jgi:hypothetical protein